MYSIIKNMTEELNHKLIRLQILYEKLKDYYYWELDKFHNSIVAEQKLAEQKDNELKYWKDNYFVLVKQRYVEIDNMRQKLIDGKITDKEIDIFYDEIMNPANNEKDLFVQRTVEIVKITPLYVSYDVKKGYNDDINDDKKKKEGEKKRDMPYFNIPTWKENKPSASG